MTGPPLIEVEDLRIDLDDGFRAVLQAVEGRFHSASIVARHFGPGRRIRLRQGYYPSLRADRACCARRLSIGAAGAIRF